MYDRKTTCGFLNICKPAGCTSRDVVNRVQKLIGRGVKLGHAGTLDPLASGVLVICVGRATRLVTYLHELPKEYEAEFVLGQTSNTDDISGKVTRRDHVQPPTREQIDEVLQSQIGEIMQRPPEFSAIKVSGQRAYKAARQGEKVELRERPVTVHSIDVLEYDFPALSLKIKCGSGTYIRSMGRDFGDALGCGGLMSQLSRTAIGPFTIDQAISTDDLANSWTDHLLPAGTAFPDTPRLVVDANSIQQLRHGRLLTIDHEGMRLLLFTEQDEFAALLTKTESDDIWRAAINWVPSWFETKSSQV